MSTQVTIIETGIANTASVAAAFRRCMLDVTLTADPDVIAAADRVVLPGVGAFGAGMARLKEAGLVDVVRSRIEARRPTLAICLGLQLLCRASDEAPGIEGLGVVDGVIGVFPSDVRKPQFGWNRVEPANADGMLQPGYAYFANSYRLASPPADWSVAWSDHGGRFVAAMESGPVLACQFHPELSGRWGLDLLKRWSVCSEETVTC